jgi:putative oxidoreductase
MCKTPCKLPCCGPQGRNAGLLILRLTLGAIFVVAGYGKLQNLGMTAGFFGSVGIPMASVMAPLVGALELLGGLMLIAGYKARIAAHWLIAIIAVAMLTTKLGQPFKMWYTDLAIFGGLFGVLASGSGSWRLLKGCGNSCGPCAPEKKEDGCCGEHKEKCC